MSLIPVATRSYATRSGKSCTSTTGERRRSEVLAKYADKNKSRRTNAALLKKPAKPCQVSNIPKPSIKSLPKTANLNAEPEKVKNNQDPSPLSQFLKQARQETDGYDKEEALLERTIVDDLAAGGREANTRDISLH